jgi:hypothetical protein
MKNICLGFSLAFCFSVILPEYAFSQTSPEISIILNGNDSGMKNYVARDEVVFSSGYNYIPSLGNTMTGSTNPELICDAYYMPTAPNPLTRVLNVDYEVGSIGGIFDVSASGGALYNVPIEIAPGTSGMEPKISLTYNSQTRNGMLGIGWDIQGLSSISRTGNVKYLDGDVSPIQLNLNDKFTFDGNRLILTSSTQYGTDLSTYSTEIETYSKIIAHATTTAGPDWFQVITKNGETLEYGNSNDSRVEPNNSTTPYVWRINKIKDAHGNYMTFTYSKQAGNSYIKKISYTGIEGGDGPYNELIFKYVEKTDKNLFFLYGKSISDELLLDKIEVLSEGIQIRSYSFNYINDAFASKLVKINVTEADGSKYNPTIFGWGQESVEFTEKIITNLTTEFTSYSVADYNGDGKDDVLGFLNSGGWKYYINQDGTSFTLSDEGLLPNGTYQNGMRYGSITGISQDFSGDGIADNIVTYSYTNPEMTGHMVYKYFLFKSLKTTFELEETNSADANDGHELIYGDFDGNGIQEIMLYSLNQTSYNGSIHSYVNSQSNSFSICLDGKKLYPINFDSDNRTELMVVQENWMKFL